MISYEPQISNPEYKILDQHIAFTSTTSYFFKKLSFNITSHNPLLEQYGREWVVTWKDDQRSRKASFLRLRTQYLVKAMNIIEELYSRKQYLKSKY
jgi:hypothetical protein